MSEQVCYTGAEAAVFSLVDTPPMCFIIIYYYIELPRQLYSVNCVKLYIIRGKIVRVKFIHIFLVITDVALINKLLS